MVIKHSLVSSSQTRNDRQGTRNMLSNGPRITKRTWLNGIEGRNFPTKPVIACSGSSQIRKKPNI